MKISDLMLTDEQRRKLNGCALECRDACETCEVYIHERAAIANAVVVLDRKYNLQQVHNTNGHIDVGEFDADCEGCQIEALLAEAREVVGK